MPPCAQPPADWPDTETVYIINIRQPSLYDVFSIEDGELCKGLERYRELIIQNKRDDAKL